MKPSNRAFQDSDLDNLSSYLEIIFSTTADQLFLLDHKAQILDFRNGSNSQLFFSPGKSNRQNFKETLPPSAHYQFTIAFSKVQKNTKKAAFVYSVESPNGDLHLEASLMQLPHQKFAVIIRDITHHYQTEENLRNQLLRLDAMRAIDSIISSSFNLNLTLSAILNQVRSVLNIDAADILLYDPETKLLELAAERGFQSPAKNSFYFHSNSGLAGQVALSRKLVNIKDIQNQPADTIREGFACYYGVPLLAKGQVKGVLELFNRTPMITDHNWLSFLETLAGQAAIAIDNITMFNDLQRSNTELSLAYDATIEGWAHALELRDRETKGHTYRVVEMTITLSRLLGIPDDEIPHIRRGALLHDIGKLAIPDSILQKPGPLNTAEWDIMRQHPIHAYEMLSSIPYLIPALDIPRHHHEKWDGTGYPSGLRGLEIPFAARLFAIVDVFDALTSDRPYRPAWSQEDALQYIQSEAGRHFDPTIVQKFMSWFLSKSNTHIF